MENRHDDLVKVLIDLPDHWAVSGESMWARALGQNLYRLENIPCYAYGVNFGDVVRAVAPDSDSKPIVQAVVERSGNQTLRVYFPEGEVEDHIPLLESLRPFGVAFEGADGGLVGLDIAAGADYGAVYDRLMEYEEDGVLEFETCESNDADRPGPLDECHDSASRQLADSDSSEDAPN